MLKRILATLVATLLTLGVSVAVAAPATAAPAWHPSPAPAPTPLFGVALYVYKKVDVAKPASWANAGPQRLVLADVDNTSRDANKWWTSLDPASLPGDVCGPGWAVQQDKVSFTGSFSFPATITPPVDNIGWPPLYDAKHQELSSLVKVPNCPGASAAVTVTPATCAAPASVALGAITRASWGPLSRSTGPGAYTVTATADPGYRFDEGTTTRVFSGTLDDRLTGEVCAPPPQCIPSSAVSYTYDPASNSGVITVTAPSRSTGALCSPFWVTATSWKYLGTSTWSQKLDQVQKLGPISAPGTYPYAAAVTCGQGDIYASFDANDPTLDPTPYLHGPDDPFDEHFLHEMGFSGPTPTYVNSKRGCNVITAEPVYTPPSCASDGSYTLPSVEHVQWYRDGAPVTPAVYPAKAGSTVKITAVAEETWVLKGGAQDDSTRLWSSSWTFAAPIPDCAGLSGSTATGVCDAGSPWISYSITLTDPYAQVTGRSAQLVLAASGESVTIPLGTIPVADPDAEPPVAPTLTGKVLWPGASVDSGTGKADGWPGWERVGATWQPTPGNFAWVRAITQATVELSDPGVDPLVVALTYPTATPDCDTQPPQDPPTLGSFPTNAQLASECRSDGRGVLTLGLVDGVSFFEDVNYFIDGAPAPSATVALDPGTYRVTVTKKNPSDGLDGPTAWTVTVTGGTVCGDLDTLALTGFDGGYLVAFAAMLLAAGAALLVTGRSRNRPAE